MADLSNILKLVECPVINFVDQLFLFLLSYLHKA